MGGNAGTQTLAVAVRALATNQLTESNTLRAFGRELTIALANGLSLGLLIGIGVALIFHNPLLGAVMGAAMVINNLVAGLGGILVPVTLDRLRIDPAVSSAVFVTTITDVPRLLSLPRACRAGRSRPLSRLKRSVSRQFRRVPKLHLTKVAFGCRTVEALESESPLRTSTAKCACHPNAAEAGRRADRRLAPLDRQAPVVGRQEILRFEDRKDGRIDIVCSAELELFRHARSARTRAGAIWKSATRPGEDDEQRPLRASAAALRPAGRARSGLVVLPTLSRLRRPAGRRA